MPAASAAQMHLAQMALAYKCGHTLEGISKAGMAKVRQMAEMGEESLRDFTHMKRRKRKGTILTGEERD